MHGARAAAEPQAASTIGQHILVATDFSKNAATALARAVALPQPFTLQTGTRCATRREIPARSAASAT